MADGLASDLQPDVLGDALMPRIRNLLSDVRAMATRCTDEAKAMREGHDGGR